MSDQERQDDVGSVSDDDACWHSSRLRMARMVEPQGCDALVDHIVLYRASARSWTEQAVAIGRSPERQQAENSRVAWRLAEVMSVDILPEELDGAQIYSEPVFLKEADTVRPGTVFVPEHSIPAQLRWRDH